VSEGDEQPIRSYQRIFRPERRIYSVEGRALPVPGGVPLRWLLHATATLVAVLVLESGSATVMLLAAITAGIGGLGAGGRGAAALAALGALGAVWLGGLALGALDWPLRLIVIPAAVATLVTQATPDGRRADRFALSWLSLRLAPRRRSLGRALPGAGCRHLLGGELWVAADEGSAELRRSRVRGPAIVSFAAPLGVRRAGPRQRRLVAAPVGRRRARRGELLAERLALGEGEALEVRP
jgi:hypothetical protein